MGYSDHTGLGGLDLGYEGHPVSKTGGFRVFSWISVGVVVLLWAMFAAAAWASPGTLTDVWARVEGLPMASRFVVWVVALPWMVGLAIWQGSWPEFVRLTLLAGLAFASVWTFYPTRTG